MASVQTLLHTGAYIFSLWSYTPWIRCLLPKKWWNSFPWCCSVPRPVERMRWHAPNLQHAGSHCDVGGRRWGQQHCWKEYTPVPDYWAESGKPWGGKTSLSHTSRGVSLISIRPNGNIFTLLQLKRWFSSIQVFSDCFPCTFFISIKWLVSIFYSVYGCIPAVWPQWGWWSFQCLEVQTAHREWADTLLPGSSSLPLSEGGSGPG